jgi:hypothetical protein
VGAGAVLFVMIWSIINEPRATVEKLPICEIVITEPAVTEIRTPGTSGDAALGAGLGWVIAGPIGAMAGAAIGATPEAPREFKTKAKCLITVGNKERAYQTAGRGHGCNWKLGDLVPVICTEGKCPGWTVTRPGACPATGD